MFLPGYSGSLQKQMNRLIAKGALAVKPTGWGEPCTES
ncbi:hypothetical protein LLB_2940 [Legionella longbeachae D-4968]|nr:hypothetical protein LLB_2940 [Legionella longbeachae D-4968]